MSAKGLVAIGHCADAVADVVADVVAHVVAHGGRMQTTGFFLSVWRSGDPKQRSTI
jgi:hypothetical protein